MSRHDEVRLERAHDALKRPEDVLDAAQAIEAELEIVGYAIAGIQSTDDPGEEYTAAHNALWARYHKLEERLKALRTAAKEVP